MSRKRLIEAGKTLLIVLLVANAVFLAGQTGLFSGKFSALPIVKTIAHKFRFVADGSSSQSGSDRANGSFSSAAAPFFMAVTWEDGSRYGLKYDQAGLSELYGRFSVALGEALGSSGKAEPVDEKEWKAALSGAGVFIDFLYDQPLSVLSGWLGSGVNQVSASHASRQLCLAKSGDDLALYYIRSEDGQAYRCDTALDFSYISAQLENYAPNGAQFAFEMGGSFNLLYPYTLLLKELPEIGSVKAENPLQSKVTPDSLLSIFGMNSYVANSYTETDGSVAYVEGGAESERILRVAPSGSVSFSQTQSRSLKAADSDGVPTAARAVEAAYSLVKDSLGAWCGDAALGLSEIAFSPRDGACTVCFDYTINGLPVLLAGGKHAAEIHVRDGAVTKAVLNFREFARGAEAEEPLPEIQAAAVVASGGGGEPLLVYEESGGEIRPAWIIN